jgi:predicted transposase YdaD
VGIWRSPYHTSSNFIFAQHQIGIISCTISDPAIQANLIAASAILAGLRLEQDVIYSLVRRDIMQESVIYRSIQEEAGAKKQREIANNLLREGLAIEMVARVTGLSLKEVQQIQQQLNESPQN